MPIPDLNFTAEVVPINGFGEDDGTDDAPPTVDAPDTTCAQTNKDGVRCVKEPNHPARHRFKPFTTGNKGSPRPRNANLAAEAATVLRNMHDMVGLGLLVTGFVASSGALAQRLDAYHESVYTALQADPKLCQMIARAGQKSAILGLVIAEATLVVGVAPYVKMELDQRAETEAA